MTIRYRFAHFDKLSERLRSRFSHPSENLQIAFQVDSRFSISLQRENFLFYRSPPIPSFEEGGFSIEISLEFRLEKLGDVSHFQYFNTISLPP